MTKTNVVIEESNLSLAWGKAFLEVYKHNEVAPMIVVIKDLNSEEDIELGSIREALDLSLGDEKFQSCRTVASTIFPEGLWVPENGRGELFERYRKIMPRMKKYRKNQYGLYFQRLIAYGCDDEFNHGVNQLEKICEKYQNSIRRRTAFHAAIFDPHEDHSPQIRRGFPCLQHVSFDVTGNDQLTITGTYVTQYMFERAYGNYLGLFQLGRFMAHEMGRQLTRVTCIAAPAVRGPVAKKRLRPLAQTVREAIHESEIQPRLVG